jgi:hypothetical protein
MVKVIVVKAPASKGPGGVIKKVPTEQFILKILFYELDGKTQKAGSACFPNLRPAVASQLDDLTA